mmetsp:Transcript_35030/g.93425  ORF Transcript_35030/g.93425 Transcript_35030/m.93425 type:complete len:148 (-) Transcript_35030:258-701(-)
MVRKENAMFVPVVLMSLVCDVTFSSLDIVAVMYGRYGIATVSKSVTSKDGTKDTVWVREAVFFDFFDTSAGLMYNLESASMVIGLVVALLGNMLALYTYTGIVRGMVDEDDLLPFHTDPNAAVTYGSEPQEPRPPSANFKGEGFSLK